MTEEISQRKNKQLCSTAVIPADLMRLACAALLEVFPPKADTTVHVSRPNLTQYVTVRTASPPLPTIATQRRHCTPQCRSASPPAWDGSCSLTTDRSGQLVSPCM
ncbi:hypothetical protein PO909_006171 [Leuciscus waleckii]